ncbi:MAG: M23 family metallopeptidase [Proteobacteria bacterium]|nr:M23 family metallopeptidase [Pseudomonadota bacterium]
MKQFFPFSGDARGRLSSGSVRFVTHRSAVAMAGAAAVVFSVIALAAGVAIGMHLSPVPGAATADERGVHRATGDYVVGEIGKLNASVAQFEPRIAYLAKQLGELRHLQSRLADRKPASQKPAGKTDRDGEGGPLLPPRTCAQAPVSAEPANAKVAQKQIDCIGALLTVLEREAVAHANAWASIPGRAPIDGARFSSSFGNRMDPFNSRLGFHSGVDLAAPVGTPILATAGGRVIYAGEKSGYGQVVEIDHGNGLVTRYAHASRLAVREGDLVLPRQHIADVGSTGRSTGPHLHMEVLENGSPINPANYMALFAEPVDG